VLRFLLAAIFLPLLLMLGCAKKANYAMNSPSYYDDDITIESDRSARGGYAAQDARSYDAPMAPSMDMAQEMEERSGGDDFSSGGEASPPDTPASEVPAPDRMVYYNGYLHLRVVRAEETTRAVAELAREAGGYVEQLTPQRVIVRIPVAVFEDTFEAALALGELLDRNVSAQDVTEAFTDVSLRLQTLKSTQERLVELLARAKTEQEKLALLREIRRVSEQIDVVEGQMRTLSELARFSRLTVQVTPRADFDNRVTRADAEGLGWIQQLSPFSRSVGQYSKRVPLAVPEGMVLLDPRGRFIAESADGAVMWTSRIENAPRGEADFWVNSIRERLSAEFDADEAESVGGFVLLRMVEQDAPEGYRYLVGVREEGRWLRVVQVYYPSAEQEERYGEAVLAAIGGGQS
jgi:hypothetical protein